jgi:tRNA(Ile)-lysidine synthase
VTTTAPASLLDSKILAIALERLLGRDAPWRLVVAVSGGADSAVLLAVAAELAAGSPATIASLRALHVDHGLAGARPLAAAAAAAARRCGIALETRHVAVLDLDDQGLEAAARRARRGAFVAALAPGEVLLTAHHLEDQAETLLLQLLRGAGLRGLAAMPALITLGAGRMVRPLLAVPRATLRATAAARQLPWHEDPMNADPAFDRNYLRHAVWPAIVARWPAAATTVARAAGHIASGQALLDTASQARLVDIADGPALRVGALAALPTAERRELLRHWLRERGLPLPSTQRIEAIERDVLGATPGAHPRMAWAGAELCRERDRLYAFAPLPLLPFGAPVALPPPGATVDLGALGHIVVSSGHSGAAIVAGVAAALTLGPRRGGERLRHRAGAPRRPVKDLLREAGVPPWTRARAVFVHEGTELVAVVLPLVTWVAEEWRARDGEPGIVLAWQGAAEPLTWPLVVEREAPFG